MEDRSRFTLPPMVGGALISKTVLQDGHDMYSAITIGHRSSDQFSEDMKSCSTRPATPVFNPNRKFRRTFKGIASAIVAQKCWATQARQKWEAELKGISNVVEQKKFDTLTFNDKAFKSHIQACGEITPAMKVVLRKFSKFRTDEEMKSIEELVKTLKVFEKYPSQIREELGRILYYDVFEDGRLITRQGQKGFSFYFIVSGRVAVERIEVDKSTGMRHVQRVDELGAGDSFGELMLLHSNTKRAASMISRGPTEFLRVDQSEFDDILQLCREKAWLQRAKILGGLIPFSNYSRKALMALNSKAKLESYSSNKVILENLKQRPDRVYFVVSGTCIVLRELIVIKRELSKKHFKYILPSREFVLKLKAGQMPPLKCRDAVERYFFLIDNLKHGDAFSGDWSYADLFYISVGKTEIVDVPILHLEKQKKNWEECKAKLTRRPLSREETFKRFIDGENWKQYKRSVVEQVLTKRSIRI